VISGEMLDLSGRELWHAGKRRQILILTAQREQVDRNLEIKTRILNLRILLKMFYEL
jgi:hypothetical protein